MKYMLLFVFEKDPVSVLCEYCVAARSMIDQQCLGILSLICVSILWPYDSSVEDS